MIRVFTDARCLLHEVPPGFPERPERLAAVVERLRESGFPIVDGCSHPAAREAVLALHDGAYVERFERAVERGDGLLDSADNPLSPGSAEAAWAAVETALVALDWVMEGPGRQALVAARPPGHHAERGLAMGFCFFNTVAVAADHALRGHGLERVAVFDFDVHHGNGTQHIFEERADVFYLSTHQYPFYPGTGAAEERGRGEGLGATLNLPLPAGSGDREYARALEAEVLPALLSCRPELLLLSVGLDAWRGDPVGGMEVSEEAYGEWAHRLGELADEVCSGRVLAVLEGGYDLSAIGRLTETVLANLGSRSGDS